jgi:uncharacterized membrane protein HdeD (DUF308 family)/alpha-beta hydrolase superfamily lysophospholipase
VVGVICTAVGVFLVLNPFASLAVLVLGVTVGLVVVGIGDLVSARDDPSPAPRFVAGVASILAAVLVASWPGATLQVLTVVVGAALIIRGALEIVGAVRATADQRVAALIGGVAAVVFGLLAIGWPDVTVFVLAVVFGAGLVVFGWSLLWEAIRGTPDDPARPRSRVRRFGRTLGAVLALAVALVLLGVSVTLHRGSPRPDGFYTAFAGLPAQPGVLLRSEPFTTGVPATAHAWRILYSTTRDDGVPATASAIVLVGNAAPAGPRPVIAWAHGTTGYAPGCAPSLLAEPFAAGATPALDEVIARGWGMVATDYVGLGTAGPHPYLIGQGEGRSVLDAVRATRQLDGVALADKTVVWGHSQGGHAALWAGILAPGYAPDAQVIGVAALAPASDLPGLVANLDTVPGGSIFASFVVQAYADTYPDVRFDDVVRPTARVQIREMATRCLAEREIFVSVVESFRFDKSIFATDPTGGAFGERLENNVPAGPITVPLLIGQGESDALVLPTAQAGYAQRRCAVGGQVDYRSYPNRDHVGVVAADSPLVPELVQWTQDRFDGLPARSTCVGRPSIAGPGASCR